MKRLSKRTLALLVAAGLLLSVGTVTGARAIPNILSDRYNAHFYLNHLQVHLVENGEDACGEVNTLGDQKVTGSLLAKERGHEIGYTDDDNLGSVEPGKVYREEIAARNGQDISQFVRITVRKYWVKTDENGKVKTITDVSGNKVPVKTTTLKPSQIQLMYDGKEGFNEDAWFENPAEKTEESSTYYYKNLLPGSEDGNSDTDLLFDQLKIDASVAAREKDPVVTKEDGKTIFTYVYKYDGCAFYIEADVQAIQGHNAQEAIESQWSPDIAATYDLDSDSGSLSLK